jgi:hypothetical protein
MFAVNHLKDPLALTYALRHDRFPVLPSSAEAEGASTE